MATFSTECIASDTKPDYGSILDDLLGPDPTQALCDAISNGQENDVKKLCHAFTGTITLSPKRAAINAERADLLRLLLEVDNLIDETMVFDACRLRQRDCLGLLLHYGWDINKIVYQAASLLVFALDDVAFANWLIDQGANVNARDSLDESALSGAMARGTIEVIQLLLMRGTDIAHGDLLHCVVEREHQLEGAKLVDLLVLKGADVNAYRYYNEVAFRWRGMSMLYTPLHAACINGNIPVARALLKHGADPHKMALEAGKETKPTPLEIVYRRDIKELLDLFMDAGPGQSRVPFLSFEYKG